MFMTKNKIKRPSLFLLASEVVRAGLEYGAFRLSRPILKYNQAGDGHPILVLPGFMAGDSSTSALRKLLNEIGYAAYGWGQGRNIADPRLVDASIEKLNSLYEQYGEKVSVIGWSLGGVYARELARACPDCVRQVITLGSPFGGIEEDNNAAWLHKILVKREKVEEFPREIMDRLALPIEVPMTAIYSESDGIVPWKCCLEAQENHQTQNIKVRGSHCGLAHNPLVLPIIFDRLMYRQSDWQAYSPHLVEELIFAT